MRGLAPRNLAYMRSFAAGWPDSILQRDAAKLPWGHIMVLIDRLDDQETRDWYAAQDSQHGWSRAVLEHHIKSARHLRVGAAPNNFPDVLPRSVSRQCRKAAGEAGQVYRRSLRRKGLEVCAGQAWRQG